MAKFDYVIVDIESYIYQACGACVTLTQVDKEGFIYTEAYDIRKGIDFIECLIEKFKDMFSSRNIILVIGDRKKNFRKEINPSYKSHRKGKPLMYDMLLDFIIDKYTVVSLPTLEADDVARIIFEDDNYYKGEKIIVTIDKDFFSVPCNLYRDNPANREIVKVSKEDALINELVQVIMGDKTDGYSGLADYGEAKAKRFVNRETNLDDVIKLYEENGSTREEALMNYRMAHIVGYNEYDFKNNKVK